MRIKSKFYKVYFSVIAVFLILLAAFLIYLRGWLVDYEAAQPETMVNSVIENYIKSDDFYKIGEMAPLTVSDYESKEVINKTISQAIKDKKITLASTASRIDGCDVAYTVKADDKKIITIYFKKTAESSSLLAKYEIISVAFDESFYKSVTVTMPKGCEIKINGVALNEKDVKTTQLPEIPEKYKSKNLSGGCYATIEKMLSTDVEIQATQDGKTLPVTKKDEQYSVASNIDEKLKKELSEFAKEASKTYSAYMQSDSSMAAIRKYFATDTEFYENIRTSEVNFVLDHEGYGFEDVKVHSIQKFSDKLYSCHVTLTQVLKRGGTKYRDYYNKNVFIYVDGDDMVVINLQSTEEKQ